MVADEFDIRRTARDLKKLYEALEEAKFSRAKPPEVRTMRPAPGPRPPVSWLWLNRSVEMEQKLREVCFNAFRDIQVKLRDGDNKVQNLLELVYLNAQPISELPWAGDFLDELEGQARTIGRWVNPPDAGKVANENPFLTADSIQRSLTAKGLECPEATIRSWAARGHVEAKTRMDGHRAYRLGDIIKRLTGEDPYGQEEKESQ